MLSEKAKKERENRDRGIFELYMWYKAIQDVQQ